MDYPLGLLRLNSPGATPSTLLNVREKVDASAKPIRVAMDSSVSVVSPGVGGRC